MIASEEPTLDVPIAVPFGAWKRLAIMLAQRLWISAVCGYSSKSMKFLDMASIMSSSASFSWGAQVNIDGCFLFSFNTFGENEDVSQFTM
jgi:hypothetical protein